MNLRAALVLIRRLARLVPERLRANWTREWEAELRAHIDEQGIETAQPFRRSLAAMADVRSLRALAAHSRPLPLSTSPGDLLGGLLKDLRYSVRSLLRSPGFTLAVTAVLALGIAANTTAFTFADDLLWRTLPADDPGRLVRIYNGYSHGFQWGSSSYPAFEEYAAMEELFDGMIGEAYLPLAIEIDGSAHRIWGSMVTPGYFELLNVSPTRGRLFTASEVSVPGQAPWVVVSEEFWHRWLGGDAQALGSRLEINGFPLTVIGVASRSFPGTQTGVIPEVWIPVTMQPQVVPGRDWLESRRDRQLWLIGSVAPGVGIETVRTELAARVGSLKARYPDEYESLATLNVLPEVEGGFHPFYREPFAQFFTMLMVVVGIVLLVACSNAAGLLVARATVREREIAIRRALGAGSWRVTRQLFVESALLAAIAGGVGVLLSAFAIRFVAGFQPPTDIPLTFGFDLDRRVLSFSVLVSILTAILFGLLPAFRASRGQLSEALRTRTGADPGGSRLRAIIVVSQVALSLALLISASLFLRSLGNATDVALGFEPSGIQIATLDLKPRGYDEQSGTEFQRQLLDRLSEADEIAAVALAARIPFSLDPAPARVAPEGYDAAADGALPTVEFNQISHTYLGTVGSKILSGRDFTAADSTDGRPVVIVSKRLAANFWPGERAVGQRLLAWEQTWEVVGVAEDIKFRTLSGEVLPYFYLPLSQRYAPEVTVYARGRPGTDVEALLRRHVGTLDASVPVFGFKSLQEQVGVALLPARMGASVLGFFGILTLALAIIGLYGVLAYSVERRRPELGVRMALGAQRRDVLRMMIGAGARLVAVGIVVGLALGIGLSRLLTSLLHGISPSDPTSYIVPAIALGLTAVAASLVPALRAAAVDPIKALRQE